MSEYVTRKEFDNSINALKQALETSLFQAGIANSVATSVLLESKKPQQALELFEKSLETCLNSFHFSLVTDEQIHKFREQYLAYVAALQVLKK